MIVADHPICPACGSEHVERAEVDIGVGILYGPWECFNCGWGEEESGDIFTLEPDDDQ